MRALALALAVVLGACSDPPLALVLGLSSSPNASCGSTSCADVTMSCGAVASIRILDPKDPRAPFISLCKDVSFDRDRDLCSLASIDLPATPLPDQTLAIEVVVYPKDDLPRDAVTGDPLCPATVEFAAADGFPIGAVTIVDPNDPTMTERLARPAIGGRAYFHPGDARTIVELGCPDLPALNAPTCSGDATTSVSATITDFDTNQPVSTGLGNRLGVSIGEPQLSSSGSGLEYVLNPADTAQLARTVVGPIPAWGADVTRTFTSAACLEVLEDISQATATLVCRRVTPQDRTIDITGVHLAKETLDQILVALGGASLDKGLVLGIVLDDLGPSVGRTVIGDTAATIRYLSADGLNFDATETTASGIFVSQDAPFGTRFTTSNATTTVFALGGLVDNKVTIVVLQLGSTTVGP